MSDSFPWFKFTVLHWMMGRIQRLSFAHQGSFMRLVCVYWTKEGKVSIEDAELECTDILYKDLVKYRIVKELSGHIQIDFMDELLAERGDVSNQKREAALERWRIEREKQMNAQAMHVHNPAMQIREEENRIEKKEENGVVSVETPRTQKKFIPPSFEEVRDHFLEKKWTAKIEFDENEESEKFLDYFNSNGWKVGGKAAMKDWKAAINNWIKRIKPKIENNGNQNNGLNHSELDELIARETEKLRSNTGQKV